MFKCLTVILDPSQRGSKVAHFLPLSLPWKTRLVMLATHETIVFEEPCLINGLVPNNYKSNYSWSVWGRYFNSNLLFQIMSQPPWSQTVNIKMLDIYDLMLAAKTNLTVPSACKSLSYTSFGATHNTSQDSQDWSSTVFVFLPKLRLITRVSVRFSCMYVCGIAALEWILQTAGRMWSPVVNQLSVVCVFGGLYP